MGFMSESFPVSELCCRQIYLEHYIEQQWRRHWADKYRLHRNASLLHKQFQQYKLFSNLVLNIHSLASLIGTSTPKHNSQPGSPYSFSTFLLQISRHKIIDYLQIHKTRVTGLEWSRQHSLCCKRSNRWCTALSSKQAWTKGKMLMTKRVL